MLLDARGCTTEPRKAGTYRKRPLMPAEAVADGGVPVAARIDMLHVLLLLGVITNTCPAAVPTPS